MTLRDELRRPQVRFGGLLAFGVAYFVLSRLSLSLAAVEHVAVIWPASGLALAVFALSRTRWWPALTATVFLSNLIAEELSRESPPVSVGLAAVNALEPVLGAGALLLLARGALPFAFGSMRSVLGLLAAATIASGVTAMLGGAVLWVGVGAPLLSSATSWWIADALGMVVVAPVIFALAADRARLTREELVVLATTAAASWLLFWEAGTDSPAYLRYPYFIFPLLLWAAVRGGPRIAGLATLVVALITTPATVRGLGPFVRPDLTLAESIQLQQGFLVVAALLPLIAAGVMAQRRAAEALLAASTERFATVLRAATELSVIGTDVSGNITLFNEGAERMLGYAADEVVGRATPAVLHDADEVVARADELGIAPGFDVFVHEAAHGRAETREWTYIRKNGARLRVSLTVTAMLDQDGGRVGYIGIASDVSHRAYAEAERAAQVRVSRAVAANMAPEAVFELVAREVGELHDATASAVIRFDEGATGTVLGSWSDGGWLTGLRVVDLEGGTAAALVHRSGAVSRLRDYSRPGGGDSARVIEAGGLTNGVGAPIVVDGRVWGSLSVGADASRPLPDDIEESLARFADLVGLAVADADHRAALRRGRDELSAIIDGLPAMVWVTDATGRVVLANRASMELGGVDALTGGPRGAPTQFAGLGGTALDAEAIASGLATQSEETLVDAAGSERTVLVARSPLKDGTGAVYALCGVATDITRLHEAERAKDEFVSVVSHELRTPLSSIQGALALLADPDSELTADARDRMVGIAASNSRRLVRLINDVLDIQRIASGEAPPQLEPCDAAHLAREACEAMSHLADERGIVIELTARSASLNADSDRIVQILNNLLSNATKYSPANGRIQFGSALVGDEVRFFVRDEGRGIPADKLEKIFERFQQVDSSDSRRVGGTGLGLAICREIAHQHGGRVWAESELDHGSCFWLALPAATRSPAAGEDHLAPDASAPVVLVCDDDPGARALARRALEGVGVRVVEAPSGQAAVRLARATPPAAILLDLVMPQMDGIETLRVLAREDATAAIPVIILSAMPPDADGPPSRVQDWITKPFSAARLVQALSGILPPPATDPPVAPRRPRSSARTEPPIGPMTPTDGMNT